MVRSIVLSGDSMARPGEQD